MSQFYNLRSMNNRELLQLYSGLMEILRKRGIIRSSNNPVADYAEKIATETLELTRADKEARGYDALDQDGNKYQVKGRRITKHNKSRQLGVIRNIEEKLFDYLIAVIFDEDFTVGEIWKIAYQFVKDNSRPSEHQNGHIFQAKPSLLSGGKGVERIK